MPELASKFLRQGSKARNEFEFVPPRKLPPENVFGQELVSMFANTFSRSDTI